MPFSPHPCDDPNHGNTVGPVDMVVLAQLKPQANRIANLIITSNLSSWETFIAYRYCWIPLVNKYIKNQAVERRLGH
jgi:hypothetical protein